MLPLRTSKIHTIRKGNKTVSVGQQGSEYVIGFRSPVFARTVLHNMHPEPRILLLRDVDNDLGPELSSAGLLDEDMTLNLDVSATLYIPKFMGNPMDPMNDGCFHVHQYSEEEFLTFPFYKNLGTAMPYQLLDETREEFVFKTLVMDPVFKNPQK
jgi:hypothetical protein